MKVYTISLVSNDNESFVRAFEMLATNTLLDLHHIIVESTKLDAKHLSSFFTVNKLLEKTNEFTLLDMKLPAEETAQEENISEAIIPTKLMEEVSITDLHKIDHEVIVYEYDILNPITLFAHISNRTKEHNSTLTYPICIAEKGKIEAPLLAIEDEIANLATNFDTNMSLEEEEEDIFGSGGGYYDEDNY